MGCWASKMDKRELLEEKMEHVDSMYVYYNPLHYSPEDRLVDSRQKAAHGPAEHTHQPQQENCEVATKQLYHKDHDEAVVSVSPDHKGADKNNNVVVNGVTEPNMIASLSSDVPRPTKADEVVSVEFENCIIEQPPAEHSGMIVQEKGVELNHNNAQRRESGDQQQLGLLEEEEEENNLHRRSPSLENYCRDSGVVGSGETAENDGDCEDGEMRMKKKLDIINDGEKEDHVDTCSEIILPTHHHPLREIPCKNLPNNNQLPRSSISSSSSLKKNRRKLRQSRIPGPRKSSGSVKSLIDATASRPSLSPTRRRNSCSHSSDILVMKYSLQV